MERRERSIQRGKMCVCTVLFVWVDLFDVCFVCGGRPDCHHAMRNTLTSRNNIKTEKRRKGRKKTLMFCSGASNVKTESIM